MPQTETETTGASWRDYLELCKPNVVALMILTSSDRHALWRPIGMVALDVLNSGQPGHRALCRLSRRGQPYSRPPDRRHHGAHSQPTL